MADPTSPYQALALAQQAGRHVTADGVRWLIYELPPLPLDRRTSPSLVFESDNVIRRVRNYPIGWRALSDEELIELSWQRY